MTAYLDLWRCRTCVAVSALPVRERMRIETVARIPRP